MSEKLTEFTEQCDDLDDFNDNDNVIIKNYEFDLDEKFTDIQETKYSPSNEHEEAINRKFCGKSECKFLFTYLQPEQETKANMHFRSFVKLAKALNRTMVLTNVGNSRINACQKFTFGFYYNVKALQKMFPDVKFITQKDFQCWSKKRRIKPNTEHVKILPGGKIQSMKLVTPYPDLLKTKSCLNRFGFKMDDQTVFKQFYTGQKSLESIKKQTKFSEFLINNLKTDVEILLTTHLVYYPLFSNISKPIPYSNHNFEEASKIINRIKPYVAIHWRMERAILDKLPECAEALVKKLQKIKESQGIQNVYLATDYPITGGTTQSQTFHLLTEKHHKAINLLNSTFNIHTWSSSKIFANLRNDEMIEKEFSGAGIPGIVDKLVCMDADYFLATPEGCGRAQSTYTTMIVNEREKSIELGVKPQLKNIVERW